MSEIFHARVEVARLENAQRNGSAGFAGHELVLEGRRGIVGRPCGREQSMT